MTSGLVLQHATIETWAKIRRICSRQECALKYKAILSLGEFANDEFVKLHIGDPLQRMEVANSWLSRYTYDGTAKSLYGGQRLWIEPM